MEKIKYITTSEAMARAGVTRPTIIDWCKRYKIGFKIGGRFRVDTERLNAFIGSQEAANGKG